MTEASGGKEQARRDVGGPFDDAPRLADREERYEERGLYDGARVSVQDTTARALQ